MEEFKVTIENFDGPLDLMLHLIKEKELDLFDLDVNVLTDQYMAYLDEMNEMHLEVASEYLVELASLIEYKSKKLLPKDQSELEDEYEEDPKERLVRRLLEYQQFKEVTSELNELYSERQNLLSKPLSSITEEWTREIDTQSIEGNPYDLVKAMERCMRRLRLSKPIETKHITREISMEKRELEVRAKLDKLPKTFHFNKLLDDCNDLPTFIVTFLAVLDLTRQHILFFTVDEKDNIWFSKGNLSA